MTPEQQALASTHSGVVDVADGEAENEGPYEAEDDLAITVDDVFGSDVCHLDATTLDVVEGFVYIFKLLYSEFGFAGVPAEGLVAEDLEKVDEDDLLRGLAGEIEELIWRLLCEMLTPSERSVLRSWMAISLTMSLLLSLEEQREGLAMKPDWYRWVKRGHIEIPFCKGLLLDSDPALLKQ